MTQHKKPNRKNPLWIFGAVGMFLLSQGKLLLSALKFGKFGGVLISMFISVGAYALIAPWQFAIGLVVMILIHELGHVLAARIKGLPVSAPVFIPFLGALITMKKHPRDAATEAFIGIGGPVLGTVGALAAYLIGLWLQSPVLVSVSYMGFFLNLINLLPIHPLDGGRISTAITRWLWIVGLIGGIVVIYYIKSILFFIIWILFAYDMYKKYIKNKKTGGVLSAITRFEWNAEHLHKQGMFIPGEGHTRDLEFTTYSKLAQQEEDGQKIVMWWHAIGFEGILNFPRQSLIKKISVVKVEHLYKEIQIQNTELSREGSGQELYLGIHVKIDYIPLDELDEYFDVPVRTRWTMGTAYLALAAFLFYMIREVHQLGI
ncbi:site-2 protease family protein [Paenibacillus hexagrammi]|uniref:Site-2 protease family protein n=1 Tax=Paenibacillus hexagrammi TaxID=2908839 RepID=A0ABY3SMY0_9BACL|nr:site-2 protease family protein [Paenibacillus sp. YPD9-1]UJF34480.1 site-2 protease family protein [Paenibacillus sp. YPD9-1]